MGLDLGNYRGLPIVEHDGALFGYRTSLLRFPGEKFTVICLCGLASAVPENLARKVADSYLADRLQPGASALNPLGNGTSPDRHVRGQIPRSPNSHDVFVRHKGRQFDGLGRSAEADQC